MAERAHPDDPGFQHRLILRWRRKIIPWVAVRRSPYREALFWRYNWAKKRCRGRDVLDIPCGMGWGTSMLVGCRSLVGTDIDIGAIQEAGRRFGNRAHFCVGDMKALSFGDCSFDVVVCLEGIEHVPCEVGNAFIREAARVLRPEGKLLLSSPSCSSGEHSGNEFHLHEYEPKEIEGLISQHFEVDSVQVREVGPLLVHYFQSEKRTT